MQEFLFMLGFPLMTYVGSIPSSDPYAEASCYALLWNCLTNNCCQPSQKTCSLSHVEIKISSRAITLKDENGNPTHFDIYRLVIALLTQEQPFLNKPFSAQKIRDDELRRFFKFFDIKENVFTGIWTESDYSYGFGTDAMIQGRVNSFANKISTSHRSTLSQYTSVYSSQETSCSCCRPKKDLYSTEDLDI